MAQIGRLVQHFELDLHATLTVPDAGPSLLPRASTGGEEGRARVCETADGS